MDQDQVRGVEVLAPPTDGLGAVDEAQHGLARLVAALLQGLGGGEGHGQDVGEAVVGGLHRTGGLDVTDETVPGVRVVQGGRDRAEQASPHPAG
ncbi:hypothetical protein QF034_007482 [Streptomyces africanus]|uniref:Uncharacterized protein n=1 Tax=Streptomyces africanus TaxID=231024 RepID=A0ABU0R0X1_9ACTN|nr:hypothetical protein [Streptomyces africanus]MDQ0753251.1 hypothetical protein [Streptomyces africanus]